MQFHQSSAEIFVPDGLPEREALSRTSHLAIGAHQDDLEIMAAAPILECFQQAERWFTGVVVTDGRGSPRAGLYQEYTDEQMRLVRLQEQKKAAIVGEFAALVMLDYPSQAVKVGSDRRPVEDIAALLQITRPKQVYTHNLADKHDTHVGVAIKVVAAIRSLPEAARPENLYGCEVWRDLDWLVDSNKVPLYLSTHENLQAALLGVFDSQISGGKRYDLATLGRRRANATYFESHGIDTSQGLAYAMDLTPLIRNPHLDLTEYVELLITSFSKDVTDRLRRVATGIGAQER